MKQYSNTFYRVLLFLILGWSGSMRLSAVGEWGIYQCFPDYTQMEYFHDKLYVLAGTNVFTYDPRSETCEGLSRLSGLSGSKVQFLAHTAEADALTLIYTDGDIDIIDGTGTIYNLPDLKNKALSGDKTLYHATVVGDDIYLATGFGFVIVDTRQHQLSDSYMFGSACDVAFAFGGNLYMATSAGLKYCSASGNPYDLTRWQTLGTTGVTEVSCTESDATSTCWLLMADGTLRYLDADGQMLQYGNQNHYTSLHTAGGYLLMQGAGLMLLDAETRRISYNYTSPFNKTVAYAYAEGDSLFYMAAPGTGLLCARLTDVQPDALATFELHFDSLSVSGVGVNNLYNLHYANGVLSGIESAIRDNLHLEPGIFSAFDGETWTNISNTELKSQLPSGKNFKSLAGHAPDPLHPGRYYIASFTEGLFCIEGDSVIALYNHNNSLISTVVNSSWDRVTAVLPDEDGYVWVANSSVTPVLKCLTPSGTWLSYPIDNLDGASFVNYMIKSKHDAYGFRWLLNTQPYNKSQCAIYYDGGTPEDLTDDESVVFGNSLTDQDGNIVSPYYFRDIAEDRNGAIWLLTSSGPFVIDSQIYAFSNPGVVRRVKVPRNDGSGLADYLLADVDVTCIAVDAANRKWIGTNGDGLYLLSADGLTTLEHFKTSNSPLFSDAILSLTIDEVTGTVYISNEGGILTYASDAIAGRENLSSVYCYPNPVRPDYTGDLHISGLMDGTEVRIADIGNRVVYAATSVGGMISWNLCNASGQRVKTGVYLIYGCSADGKKGMVCKCLVVR